MGANSEERIEEVRSNEDRGSEEKIGKGNLWERKLLHFISVSRGSEGI